MIPITHPRTQRQIEDVLKRSTHGLILSGQEGSGKYFIAQYLANQLAEESITIEPLEEKSTISIEQIRSLYSLTKTGSSLAVILKDSEHMGIESQNAFLKLLEEPPKNITFILTVKKPESLLSTIRSRTQVVEVLPVPATILTAEAIKKGYDNTDVQVLLHTTNQLAGTFFSLLNVGDISVHTNKVSQAKQFFSASTYQRHKICQQNSYDKEWAKQLLSLLALIIQTLLKQATSKALQDRLIAQANLVETTTQNLIKYPGNPKIHLAKLSEEL